MPDDEFDEPVDIDEPEAPAPYVMLEGCAMDRFSVGECPGCGTPTPIFELPRFTGERWTYEKHMSHCRTCIDTKTAMAYAATFNRPQRSDAGGSESQVATGLLAGVERPAPPAPAEVRHG